MAHVPDGGSVAPVTDTWSAVTGVTGNLLPGPSGWQRRPDRADGRRIVAGVLGGRGYAVQSGERPNAVMSRSWGSSGTSPGGRSAMAPALR